MDLYEPGSGSQVKDFNGGILASGLFWTVPVQPNALRVSADGRRAVLQVEDLPVIDSFQFFSLFAVPATVSMSVHWSATGPFEDRGSGEAVPLEDPAAFTGRIAEAVSTATFSGAEFGFSFRSDPGVSTERTYADIGIERNGAFL